jgi:hypothetical protein
MRRREAPRSCAHAALPVIALALTAAAGHAQVLQPDLLPATTPRGVILHEGFEPVTYWDGTADVIPSRETFRLMCGSDDAALNDAELARIAAEHRAVHQQILADQPVEPQARLTGLDVNFILNGSVPSQAVNSFALAEQYLESLFSDPIRISISVSFGNLGGGVIGGTSVTDLQTTYSNARSGLVNNRDSEDTLQPFLPTGSTIPVRYNGSSSSVTNENRVFLSRANFNATVGNNNGNVASMTYNTAFNFDFNPANGVSGGSISLVDVIIHETGHAMGFTSGIDFRTNDIESIDLVRFQRTDGSGDFNPDNTAEFQARPRTVDLNNPNDDQNFDFIVREHRASDGSPFQASHFREQGSNIGIMDPAFSGGQTFINRNPFGYFSQADIDMFDFIGWDYPPCESAVITAQPSDASACENESVQLSVFALGAGSFQWNRNGSPISNGADFSGANTDTLTINAVSDATAGTYTVTVDIVGGGCPTESEPATVSFTPEPPIFGQPEDVTACVGEPATFSAAFDLDQAGADYQWYENGIPLSNGGGISGATSFQLTIASVSPADSGNTYSYDTIDEATGCAARSDSATLTVATGPAINTQPTDLNVDEGDDAVFTVASSGPNLVFAWFRDGIPATNGTVSSGATSSTFTISNAEPSDEGTYTAVVTNTATGCETTSDGASLTVNPAATGCNVADIAAPFGSLTFGDISAFIAAFQANDPAADIAAPFGEFTFGDISTFIAAFSAGCP